MNVAARSIVAVLGIVAMAVAVAVWTEHATVFLSIVGGATLGILWVFWWMGEWGEPI